MSAVERVFATGSSYVDDLLTSRKWADGEIRFGFSQSASIYGANYANGEPTKGFAPLSAPQQLAVREAMKLWDELIGLRITESSANVAEIRLATSSAPSTAWAYLPSSASFGGDVWIGTANFNANPVQGNYAYMTILHEIGHALGLGHPHQATTLGLGNAVPEVSEGLCPCCGGAPHGQITDSMAAATYLSVGTFDAMPWSVMSYSSHLGANINLGYTNEIFGYAQTPMARDIAAIQHLYGANYNTRSGDTVYQWSETTGEKFINGVGQGRPGANKVFETVWDGGGNDTFNLSNFSTNLTINLQPGGWTDFGNSQIARLGNGHTAPGNVAVAHLHEGDARAYIENAIGGKGHDQIMGNAADNVLVGGAGNDTIKGIGGKNILIGDSLGNELTLVGLNLAHAVKVALPRVDAPGNDLLIGGAGNDIFIPGFGKNVVQGGGGSNTLILALSFDELTISKSTTDMIFIVHDRGSVEATGIDMLALSDGIFSLAGPLDQPESNQYVDEITLLYRASLGRDLDAGGLEFWVGALQDGQELDWMALALMDSAEFTARFGSLDTLTVQEFIDVLYLNVLGRLGQENEVEWWAESMENGNSHSKVLQSFAFSDENRVSLNTNGLAIEADGLELVAISQTEWAQIWA